MLPNKAHIYMAIKWNLLFISFLHYIFSAYFHPPPPSIVKRYSFKVQETFYVLHLISIIWLQMRRPHSILNVKLIVRFCESVIKMRHDDNEKNKWISSMPSLSFHYQGLLQHNTLEVILSIIFIVAACWMMISFHSVVVDDTKEGEICWWSILCGIFSRLK